MSGVRDLAHHRLRKQLTDSVALIRQFDPDWPLGHETMNGDPARIIHKGLLNSEYQLVVIVTRSGIEDGDPPYEECETYKANGLFYDKEDCGLNLRNKPAPGGAI